MHEEISFADFEKHYIARPDGYLPVWFSFEEPEEEEGDEAVSACLILKMDMLIPERLTNGKTRFLSVQIDSKEQAEKAMKYLRETQKLLYESLEDNFATSAETLSIFF